MVASIRKEEIIFFINLITDYLPKKTILKSLRNFIREKKKYSLSNPSSFGLVLFQQDSDPIAIYDEPNEVKILELLDHAWESREMEKNSFENGLFEILSYVFRKGREIKNVYRVLVISDAASTRSDEYYNAAYELIIKAKYFDTIIDVIRVGDTTFYEDEIRLKVITSESNGGLFFCDAKQFDIVLSSLIQRKSEFPIIQPTREDLEKMMEDKTFYEKLAVDLISLDIDDERICSICQKEICAICELNSDDLSKCFNCGAKFHSCCITEYAIANNIGLKHIFRCPNCETLLKIDEEFAKILYTEKFEEDMEEKIENKVVEKEIIENELQVNESGQVKENIIKSELEEEKPPETPQKVEEEVIEEKEITVGGYFGPRVKVKTKKQLKIKELEEPLQEENIPVRKSITSLKPPSKVKICPICGANIFNSFKCNNCGYRF
ncbi:MAG: RING finger protein [Promethearchaeota archaeon]